jgi:hypothetical protein
MEKLKDRKTYPLTPSAHPRDVFVTPAPTPFPTPDTPLPTPLTAPPATLPTPATHPCTFLLTQLSCGGIFIARFLFIFLLIEDWRFC